MRALIVAAWRSARYAARKIGPYLRQIALHHLPHNEQPAASGQMAPRRAALSSAHASPEPNHCMKSRPEAECANFRLSVRCLRQQWARQWACPEEIDATGRRCARERDDWSLCGPAERARSPFTYRTRAQPQNNGPIPRPNSIRTPHDESGGV